MRMVLTASTVGPAARLTAGEDDGGDDRERARDQPMPPARAHPRPPGRRSLTHGDDHRRVRLRTSLPGGVTVTFTISRSCS